METWTGKQLPVSNNLIKEEPAYVPPENMLNEELQTLNMAFIQTLKCSNKKCGKDEVFELVNNSLQKEISRKLFERLLYQLTEKQYVQLNVFRKRTCWSLPKESWLNKESNIIAGSGNKEDKRYHGDIVNENGVTGRLNVNDWFQ